MGSTRIYDDSAVCYSYTFEMVCGTATDVIQHHVDFMRLADTPKPEQYYISNLLKKHTVYYKSTNIFYRFTGHNFKIGRSKK